jgi:hypothetical protein
MYAPARALRLAEMRAAQCKWHTALFDLVVRQLFTSHPASFHGVGVRFSDTGPALSPGALTEESFAPTDK